MIRGALSALFLEVEEAMNKLTVLVLPLMGLVSIVAAQPHVDLPPAKQNPKPPDAKPLEISGRFQYKDAIRERSIVFRDGATVICARNLPLRIEADTIEWNGKVAVMCSGTDGANGANGTDRGGWCVGEDQGNWENNFNNGGNDPGGDGANGEIGTDGSDVAIIANNHVFTNGAVVTIDTRGGRGGNGGRAGKGRQKCSAPSGDDCRHGTRLRNCKVAPDGISGYSGYSGLTGRPEMKGMVTNGKGTLVVNGVTKQVTDSTQTPPTSPAKKPDSKK